MKFSKLSVLFIIFILIISGGRVTFAKTVTPILDKNHKPVQDFRGNCARTKWLADQCCDICGFPKPEQPLALPQIVEKQKKIQYIDLIRQSIYFDIDKDNIDAVDEQRMRDVMNEINKSAAIRNVKMVGYADRFASRKYNKDLSKRRAAHVLEYFRNNNYFNNLPVGFGFFGKDRPVTNCPKNVPIAEQIICLQADRRVDIEVEVLRERVEVIKETVVPQYPRPGTAGVEVYSRPVDPGEIERLRANQGYSGAVLQMPKVPVPEVQSEETTHIYQKEIVGQPQNIDVLGKY